MVDLKRVAVLLGGFGVFAGSCLGVAGDAVAQTLSSKRECAICHIEWMDDFAITGKKLFVDRIIRGVVMIAGRQGVVSTEEICYTCHDGSVLDSRDKTWMKGSHPVYVKPSENVVIPKTFPLDKDGKIYCGTCHSAHGVDWGKKPEDVVLGKTIFLRYDNPDSFLCRQCHVNKIKGKEHNNHPINVNTIKLPKKIEELGGKIGLAEDQVICETCHKVHGAKSGYKLLIARIDDSQLCAICHTDKIANTREEAEAKHTHPVDVVPKYTTVADSIIAKGGKRGEDGKIICMSCHKPHNAPLDTKLLVAKNSASALCIECHGDKLAQVAQTKHDMRETGQELKNIKGQTVAAAGVCEMCHLPHNGKGAKMWALEPAADHDPIGRLCLSCHQTGGVAEKKQVGKITHPYGVNYSKAKAVEGTPKLPLFSEHGAKILDSQNGNVTCSSCHDVHRWDPASLDKQGIVKAAGTPANSFLRMKNDVGSPLCYECHSDKSYIEGTEHDMSMMAYKHPRSHCLQILGEDKNDMQKLPPEVVHKILGKKEGATGICGTCHTPHNAQYIKLWSREPGEGNNAGEKLCFTCHASGKVAEVKQVGKYSHPVGVPLKNIAPDIDTWLPTWDSETHQRKKDGEVLCATCHNLHQWDPNKKEKGPGQKVIGDASNKFLRIAASNNQFALCDACHVDKKFIKGTKHDLSITAPEEKNFKGETVAQSGVCGACHTVHNAMNKYRLWNRELGPGRDGVTELCKSCHSDGRVGEKKQVGSHSHPVNVSIKGATLNPISFPTYDDKLHKVPQGNILCSSCHNLHVWDGEKPEIGPGKNSDGTIPKGTMLTKFLRWPNKGGYALCVKCHQGKEAVLGTSHDLSITAPEEKNYFGQTVAQTGPCGACHVVHNTLNDLRLWSRSLGPGDDGISKLCRSCHDKDRVAKTKQISMDVNTHPINANIRAADRMTDYPLFNFEGRRDKENGKVYCASCHDPHVWDPANKEKPGPGVKVEGDQHNSFLRDSNLPEPVFCANCHSQKTLVSGTPHDLRLTAPNEKNLAGESLDKGGVCSACHIVHNAPNKVRLWSRNWGPSFIKQWSRELGEEDNRAVQFCTSCHSDGQPGQAKQPPRGLHPYPIFVGVRRAAYFEGEDRVKPFVYLYKTLTALINPGEMLYGRRPAFPPYDTTGHISPTGNITCPTCHNPHQWDRSKFEKGPGRKVEGSIQNSFLREGFIYDFCIDCHGYDTLWRVKYFHTDRGRTAGLDPKTKYDEVEALVKGHPIKPVEPPKNPVNMGQPKVNP